jgi:hypothetical protein
MNSHLQHQDGPRGADASLTSIIEEAIADMLTPPLAEAGPVEPAGAESFIADAVVFLRARPDAAELLNSLQAMMDAAQEPSHLDPQPKEATSTPAPIGAPGTDLSAG